MADENDLSINIGINPAGAEAGARRTNAAVGSVVSNTQEMDAAFRKIKAAIDPAFAAQERYNRAVAAYDQQLKSGKISQAEYAAQINAVKTAYDAQISSIERNSAAARRAEQERRVGLLQEAQAREAAARESSRIANEWLATERRNTQLLKQEAITRTAAEKAAIREAVTAAKQAAAEKAAAARAAGGTVTRTQETQMIREAAAAAKQAASERVAAERSTNEAITASYRETYQAAKALAQEASAEAAQAARQRQVAEQQVAEAVSATEKAERREAARAAREGAMIASAAAREKAQAERQAAAATREQQRATEEAARAARQEAAALEEMRASINPAFAAQMRYNETMQRATQLLMANKLQQGEWNQIQRQARTQMDLNVRSMGRMNAMNVQMGYQMQDVVASWASGISPLVILAQQGGQTAAALSQMGGTAGRVAAFFAGPWGAAILGAVMVLGFLWEANKKGESATKDVMDAEDRRRMSVKELTAALEEYVKTQRQANQEALAGKIAQQAATADIRNEQIKKYTDAKANLDRLEKQLKERTNSGPMFGEDPTAYAAGIAALTGQIYFAKRQVESLKDAYELAVRANAEAAAATAQQIAGSTELERRLSDERTALYEGFLRDHAAATGDMAKQTQIQIRYQQELQATEARYAKLKEESAKADRAAAKEESLRFKSREDAIQRLGNALIKRGFSERMENFGVGDKRVGAHPGMGREAHGKYAIDVNIPGAGVEANSAIYKKQMDEEVRAAQAAGYRVLWNGKIYEPHGGGPTRDIPKGKHQHRDHAHIEAPASIVGKPAGSELAGQLQTAQMQAIQDQHDALIADLDFKKELAGEELSIVLELQDQKIAAQRAYYGAGSKEELDAMRERVRINERLERQTTEERKRAIEQRLALSTAAAERERAISEARAQQEADMVEFLRSNSLITEEQALTARGQMLDREFQLEVGHENRLFQLRVTSLREQLENNNLTTKQRDDLHRELERLEAEHLGRMQMLQNGYDRDVNQLQYQSMSQTLQRWKGVTDTFTQSMGSAFQGLWTRSQSFHQSMINMADQMVYKFVDMGLQMLSNWIMTQLGMSAAQQVQDRVRTGSAIASEATKKGVILSTQGAAVAAEGIKTGAAVSGAAAQTGAAAAAGTTEITTNAAVAAAGAYKSTVVIPFIGPVAAPAAAALALAAVLGFGALISAKGGMGEVPSDQLAMVHKKEMILPAWIAEPLRQSLSAPSSSGMMMGAAMAGSAAREARTSYGDNFEFNYQPKHTNMGATMDELLRKDGQQLRKWIKNEIRNGNLKAPR